MKRKSKTKNKVLQSLFRNTAQSNNIMPYKNTQYSSFIPLILLVAVAITLGIGFKEGGDSGLLFIVSAILFAFIPLFSSLTVKVATNQLQLHFGVGLIKKTINLDELESAKVVKTSWVAGYGIRILPGGMLYNIQGAYSVELRFKNKRSFIRVGTNEPEELLKAIENQRLL